VEFRGGRPVAGGAVLDLRRITCSDLAGNPLHDVLIHHLQSDDFFDVERFPEARFSFSRAEPCGDRPGSRNLKLHGELTLRGVTRPLVVEAASGVTPEGKGALQGAFALNRTEWGVLYGSGSFFKRLAGHLVNDEIEIHLRILTA
jgi:polyisoprenoid-binding protein YceI